MKGATWVVWVLLFALLSGCTQSTSDSRSTTPSTKTSSASSVPTSTTVSTATTPSTTTPTTPTTTPPPPVTIKVKCNLFEPNEKTVGAGTPVTWEHECGGHTVTIHKDGTPTGQYVHDASLSSGTTSYTFPSAGLYHVFCKPHSNGDGNPPDYETGMVSKVTVT